MSLLRGIELYAGVYRLFGVYLNPVFSSYAAARDEFPNLSRGTAQHVTSEMTNANTIHPAPAQAAIDDHPCSYKLISEGSISRLINNSEKTMAVTAEPAEMIDKKDIKLCLFLKFIYNIFLKFSNNEVESSFDNRLQMNI